MKSPFTLELSCSALIGFISLEGDVSMTERKFKGGDRLLFARQPEPPSKCAAVAGKATATVVDPKSLPHHLNPHIDVAKYICVLWDDNVYRNEQSHGYYSPANFDLLKEEPVKTFDPTKPVQTRDGRKARIICTDAKGNYPIIYLTNSDGDNELARHATKDGINFHSSKYDLINIPTKVERWINVYPSTHACSRQAAILFDTKRAADASDKRFGDRRIDCIRIEWELP